MNKRFLVVVHAGDASRHLQWLGDPASRRWDLVVNYHGDVPENERDDGLGTIRIDGKGPKWAMLHRLLEATHDAWRSYDYIWLPDDDVETTCADIERMFDLMAALGLHLAQPSTAWDGATGVPLALHNANFAVRHASFVESTMPCFSRTLLERVLPTLPDADASAAIGNVWPRFLDDPRRECAILDRVQVRRGRVGGDGRRPAAEWTGAAATALLEKYRVAAPQFVAFSGLDRDGGGYDLFGPDGADFVTRLCDGFLDVLRSQEAALGAILKAHTQARREALAQQAAAAVIGPKVVLGAAGTARPGWIATDFPAVDITDRGSLQRAFPGNDVALMLAEHVWEHLTPDQGRAAARHCYAALKPGGRLRVAVPDGLHPDPAYIDYVRPGGHGVGSDDHKVLYDVDTLSAVFESAGFTVTPLEWFDRSGSFNARPWNPDEGYIDRSTRFDERNRGGNPTAYTSIIIDAIKPAQAAAPAPVAGTAVAPDAPPPRARATPPEPARIHPPAALPVRHALARNGRLLAQRRDEILRCAVEFARIWPDRPFDNTNGLALEGALALFFFLREMNPAPEIVMEIGTWRGFSTWVIRRALPHARIICSDPILSCTGSMDPAKFLPEYRPRDVEYTHQDFSNIDLTVAPAMRDKVVVFFDDHQHKVPRTQQAAAKGIRHLIFDDNVPVEYTHASYEHLFAVDPARKEAVLPLFSRYDIFPSLFEGPHQRWPQLWLDGLFGATRQPGNAFLEPLAIYVEQACAPTFVTKIEL